MHATATEDEEGSDAPRHAGTCTPLLRRHACFFPVRARARGTAATLSHPRSSTTLSPACLPAPAAAGIRSDGRRGARRLEIGSHPIPDRPKTQQSDG
jgi:hypothetical protein